jgi:DICT domain-containing protein
VTDVRDATPFALARAVGDPRPVSKSELVRLSRQLEREALRERPPAIAACLQDSRFLTDATRGVYARLAAAGCRARLHARGMQAWLAPGVEGVPLDEDSPLADEWVIVVPGRVLFAASDLHWADVEDAERTFTHVLTRESGAVAEAARLLGV